MSNFLLNYIITKIYNIIINIKNFTKIFLFWFESFNIFNHLIRFLEINEERIILILLTLLLYKVNPRACINKGTKNKYKWKNKLTN